MSIHINEQLELTNGEGRKLTRAEIATLVDNLEGKYGRPYHVYLATNQAKSWLKVGISNDTGLRKYSLRDEIVGQVEMTYWIKVMNQTEAKRIETSILAFLTTLRGLPVYKTEWFPLKRNDFELIQWLMMSTPYAALPGIFDYLCQQYNRWLFPYLYFGTEMDERDYVIEEITLSMGKLVLKHFEAEVEARTNR